MSTASDWMTIVDLARSGARSRVHQLGGLLLVALALLPLLVSDYLMLQLAGAMFFAVFTISWDFVSGYTGYISFGHAVFFGAAGYGSAILNVELGMDPLLSIPIGVFFAIVVGLMIGIPALRLEGPYLSLITLIAPLILLQVFIYFRDITGGQRGLFGVDTITFDPMLTYYIGFTVLVVSLLITLALTRSNLGTILSAISGDEEIVSASGLNPAKYKIFAFVLSGAIGGLAGAVFTHTSVGSATPSLLLGLLVSANVIIAAVIGGMGTITGAAIGGFAFYIVREVMRGVEAAVPIINVPFHDVYLILMYLLAMAILIFLPDGLVPWAAERIKRSETRIRGGNAEPVTDGGRSPAERAMDKFEEQLREISLGEDDDER